MWTTPGPPTQSTFLPFSLASRMPSATCRTSNVCGFSEDTTDSMKPNASASFSATGISTLMPLAPVTTHMPARTSDIGRVTTRVGVPSSSSSTIRPQSISGFSTGSHLPFSRTLVARLVVE